MPAANSHPSLLRFNNHREDGLPEAGGGVVVGVAADRAGVILMVLKERRRVAGV